MLRPVVASNNGNTVADPFFCGLEARHD